MALGAASSQVVRLVVTEGLTLVAWGSALGLVIVVALSPLLGTVLYGVAALDPWTLSGVALLLALAALGATALPARRAAGLAPATVLRDE